MQTLKLAFKMFDTDADGEISYPEVMLQSSRLQKSYPPATLALLVRLLHQFVAALERYGVYSSQAARGLFDRYNVNRSESLSYLEFSNGLFETRASRKPPSPPKRSPAEVHIESKLDQRQSPANSWATSVASISPSRRPTRVHSLANDKWKDQAARGELPKWERDPSVGGWRECG